MSWKSVAATGEGGLPVVQGTGLAGERKSGGGSHTGSGDSGPGGAAEDAWAYLA